MSALLMCVAACFASPAALADSSPIHFDIPAGDAQQTLLTFLTQSRIEMLYQPDEVNGVHTRAVSGDLTVEQALVQMLADTDLQVEFENDFSFAKIRAAKKNDTGGMAGTAEPILTVPTEVNMRDLARGVTGVPVAALRSEPNLEEVVVTGTLFHGALDVMSPLEYITHNDIKRANYATLNDVLQTLTYSSNGGPSEDFGGLGNLARGSSVNLRGLGAGATLVLVDGQRQPFSGTQADFVDISSIPVSAVERIEVLPDGDSALYGSDAIAGVVNVIMRKDLVGGETWARFGATEAGADEKLISQLFGKSWRSGRMLLTYQYSERGALAAGERSYASDADKRPLGGTDHRIPRSVPGNVLDPATFLPVIPIGQDGSLSSDTSAINLLNRNTTKDLLPEKRIHNVFMNVSQHLGERSELFATGRYSNTYADLRLYGWDQVLMVPNTNPYVKNPFPQFPFVLVGYNFLNDLGPITQDALVQSASGTVGIKKDIGDTWRITVSGSYGREALNSHAQNLVDQDALAIALASPDMATAFNAFGDGRHNNAGVTESIRATETDLAVSKVTSGTVVADGTLGRLWAGDTKLAVGGEFRTERFGNASGIGDVAGRGTPYARRVESAFGELSVPLVGVPGEPRATPRLELSLAGRYERYDDFGSTWNPKIGLRWAPWESVKVRTSWGTSFKAPKLTDLFDSSHNVAGLTALKDPRSPSGSSLVLFTNGNNPDLNEETASTWTAGIDFAFRSLPDSSFSLTYYSIDYTDRIVVPGLPSLSDILLQEQQWAPVIKRNPSSSDIEAVCSSPVFFGSVEQCRNTPVAAIIDYHYRNLSSTRVKGLDASFDQSRDTSHGNFRFGFRGTYLLRFDQAASNASPMTSILDTAGNPLSLRLRGTVEWNQHRQDMPGWGAGLTIDHSGGYRDADADSVRGVAGFTAVDLNLSYRTPRTDGFLSDLEFGLNAANVFNSNPPFIDREDGYDLSNYDPYGRVLSLGIQKKW